MLSSNNIMGFVTTTDAVKARSFYEKQLGLQFISEDPFAIVFKSNGLMIRVSKTKDFVPQPFTVLGWDVKNIESTAAGLTERGIRFERFEGLTQDELGIWNSPSGAKVAWFKDSDGNLLSLTQF